MTNIHKTAIISKNAVIGKNVTIGAYSIIGDYVKIANNNIIYPSVVIDGNTDIDENNKFYSFSSIGSIPQDLKYRGEKSKLIIGKNNVFREHCTANLGTEGDNMETIIGNGSLFLLINDFFYFLDTIFIWFDFDFIRISFQAIRGSFSYVDSRCI